MKKTISFAIVHFSVAFIITYLMTGSILLGSAVALIEPMVNTVAFYIHEKVWELRHTPPNETDIVPHLDSQLNY